MPEKDYSKDTLSRTLELLTKSLEEHENEMDRIIEKLETVKDNILAGYGSLKDKLEVIAEETGRVECDVDELKKSLL